jgi:predicted  nucleic acid-binding Zn-ribbon protein
VSEVPLDLRVIAERVSEVVNRKLSEFDKKYGERVEALEKRIGLLEAELAAVRTGFVKDIVKSVIDAKIEDVVISAIKNAVGVLISDLDTRVKSINEGLSLLNKNISDLRDSVSVAKSDVEKSVEAVSGAVRKSLDSLQSAINGLTVAVGELRDLLKKLFEVIDAVNARTIGILERVQYIDETVREIVTKLATPSAPLKPPEEGVG